MGRALMSISERFLKDLLKLPKETELLFAEVDLVGREAAAGSLILLVDHPDIPEAPEGARLMFINPEWRKIKHPGGINVVYLSHWSPELPSSEATRLLDEMAALFKENTR